MSTSRRFTLVHEENPGPQDGMTCLVVRNAVYTFPAWEWP